MPPDASLPGLAVQWPAPGRVRAFMSTRAGGVSQEPFASLNLGAHVGDDPDHVAHNRALLANRLGVAPVWLNQVHGNRVVVLEPGQSAADLPPADASVTATPGVACAVLVADCLPVLLAADNGRAVGAAHAGWRGLAAGVLEQTVRVVSQAAGCSAGEVHAWLGPCIGPRQFEVGDEVRDAFGPDGQGSFAAHCRRDGSAAWLADLPALARSRLRSAGVVSVSGGSWCTVEDRGRFFSFRRDRVTGRLAAAVMLG